MEIFEPTEPKELKMPRRELVRIWIQVTQEQYAFLIKQVGIKGHVSFSETLRAIIQDKMNERGDNESTS